MMMRFPGTARISPPSGSSPSGSWRSSSSSVGSGPAMRVSVSSYAYQAVGCPFPSDLVLDPLENRIERRARDREAVLGDRRRHEVLLEVVELELRRLADQLRRLVGIVQPRELDDDLVRRLRAQLGLARADLVDPVADDLDRAVEILVGHLLAGWGLRLENHLEAALQVEPEHRRAGDRERRDRAEQGHDEEDDEVVAAHG